MAKFFIDRPIFAWVVAIFIILLGIISATRLPIEQYPNIAKPTIRIEFVYTGANAEVIQDSVISVIEEQMNGLEGIDYIESSAFSNGVGSINLTFKSGTDDNLAQVDVQNNLSQVEARLPRSVRDAGIKVSKSQSNFLLIVALFNKESSNISSLEIANYASHNIKPILQRVEGVGDVRLFTAEPAMRIWVDPKKLKSYNLSFNDVVNAIRSQNATVTAGILGQTPSVIDQRYTASINISGQLHTPQEFSDIILKSSINGATVRIKDIGIIELGQQSYQISSRLNGRNAVFLGIYPSTTGNAVASAEEIRNVLTDAAQYMPDDIDWTTPFDSSKFIKLSIEKVLQTLIEAILLVFIVMFLFLQNIRYTIIPTLVVPISLLGAVATMQLLGLTINVLTMFAMVLVIGIVVDDAIVVVENIERLMKEEQLTPYQAANKGMKQITGAIVGITLVLIVVFLPSAIQSGSAGAIYRQFALVMMAAIAISAILALSLTPALCASLLKPIKKDQKKWGFFRLFNTLLKYLTNFYHFVLEKFIRLRWLMLLVFAGLSFIAVIILQRLPSTFLPTEDQGYLITSYQLPPGANKQRTQQVVSEAEKIIRQHPAVKDINSIVGFSIAGQGENMGITFTTLKDWAERKSPELQASTVTQALNMQLQRINQALIFTFLPPSIPALGSSSGFDFWLEDRNNLGHKALIQARNQLLGAAAQSKLLTSVRPNGVEDSPQLRISIDRNAMFAQNVSLDSISSTLGIALGSSYVNDFISEGSVRRVYVMADAAARMQPNDILNLTTPNNTGKLVPLSSLLTVEWEKGAEQVSHYNGYTAVKISGNAAPGYSSGVAIKEITRLKDSLPKGFAIEWAGQSLEEIRAGNSTIYLYAFSALAIFLCLAALYESWSIPFAVLLTIPLGILGVAVGNFFRGYANDIYFRIGMITVMGLSAKNAILIVEFAKEIQAQGKTKIQAALGAAYLRFRPILMTSLAFISGVVPLYFATGASAASQRAIGTSVFWGMIIGTVLATIFVPIFYIIVRSIFKNDRRHPDKYAPENVSLLPSSSTDH